MVLIEKVDWKHEDKGDWITKGHWKDQKQEKETD